MPMMYAFSLADCLPCFRQSHCLFFGREEGGHVLNAYFLRIITHFQV